MLKMLYNMSKHHEHEKFYTAKLQYNFSRLIFYGAHENANI